MICTQTIVVLAHSLSTKSILKVSSLAYRSKDEKGGVILSIGLGEIIAILIVGFLVVGPEDLPKVARTIASWIKKIRGAMKDVTKSFEEEIEIDELKKDVKAVNSEVERMQKEVLLHAQEAEKTAVQIKE